MKNYLAVLEVVEQFCGGLASPAVGQGTVNRRLRRMSRRVVETHSSVHFSGLGVALVGRKLRLRLLLLLWVVPL